MTDGISTEKNTTGISVILFCLVLYLIFRLLTSVCERMYKSECACVLLFRCLP